MKAEYMNPFIQASHDVFRLMMDLEPERGSLHVVEDLLPAKEANVLIGVTGMLSGYVLFSFPKDMMLEMVRIMSGMEVDELDSFVTSALSEVANIISGNALTYLSQKEITCDLVPPQIMIGSGQAMNMVTEKALVVPMGTSIGEFDINLTLREK